MKIGLGGRRAKSTELTPDFVVQVYEEKLSHNGEDSYYYALGDQASVVAALDGCGGSGARSYERIQGKTGAFVASRVIAGAVRDWFGAGEAAGAPQEAAELLSKRSKDYLAVARQALGGTSRMRGSLSKELPTTLALEVLRRTEEGAEALCLWAGDSRCYLLDVDGLHQLTTDDLGGLDAMQNLTADGVLTNVISASTRFAIHATCVKLPGPCMLFAATDGCFGYLSTPMEFEHVLLQTLCAADTPAEWERKLAQAFASVAGDDATFCGMSVGFGSYQALVRAMRPRLAELEERYVAGIALTSYEEKLALWEQYRGSYEAYLACQKG